MAVNSVASQDVRALAAQFQPRTSQQESSSKDEAAASAPTVRLPKTEPETASEDSQTRKAQSVQSAALERTGTKLRLDEASKRVIAQIMGQDGEVLQQIPPEEQLEIMERVRQIQGLLFDELA